MKIVKFDFDNINNEYLEFIKKGEWGAAKYLFKLIKDKTYHKEKGENARLFIMLDENKPIAFCNVVEEDYIKFNNLDRFIAMLYIDPEYRNKGLSKVFIKYSEGEIKDEGFDKAYIVTQHKGLYEKMGYKLLQVIDDGPHEIDYLYEKTL